MLLDEETGEERECGYAVHAVIHFNGHVASVHDKTREWRCWCGVTSTTDSGRIKHRRTHEPLIECPVPGCISTSRHASYFNIHIRKHGLTPEKIAHVFFFCFSTLLKIKILNIEKLDTSGALIAALPHDHAPELCWTNLQRARKIES